MTERVNQEQNKQENPGDLQEAVSSSENLSDEEAKLLAEWEEALKEAKEASKQEPSTPKQEPIKQEPTIEAKAPQLEEFTPSKGEEGIHPSLDFILDIPLEISVEIGRCKMIINDLLKLSQGSIIELNKMAGEPAEIYVNQRLMARGEIVVINDRFAVRLTEIISPQERVRQLGS